LEPLAAAAWQAYLARMEDFNTLIDGYRRFRAGEYTRQRSRWTTLADGQEPKIMVIACSDSRVDPSTIFDTEPGQMFVVRNVANLVPQYEPDGGRHGVSAALEFAVEHLKVRDIIVMGHAQCGGIKAALRPHELRDGSFIGRWMALIDTPRERVLMALEIEPGLDPQQALEFAAIRQSIENLRGFPFVAAAEASGTLALRGAYFGIKDGILHLLDSAKEQFVPVEMNDS
jgi:carbonic anhydrase